MLSKILDTTKNNIRIQQDRLPEHILRKEMEERETDIAKTVALLPHLIEKSQGKMPAIVAEIKRASPSKGKLRNIKNPAKVAKEYQEAGAAAISVLTETDFFHGSIKDFLAVKDVVRLPVLRKDFIISLYQIYQSKHMGADIILLIMAALNHKELVVFHQEAKRMGLQCLLEVHNREELERLKTLDLKKGEDYIGINNRDLKSMEVDLRVTEKLCPYVPSDIPIISESGIRNSTDCHSVKRWGATGVLVGESLVRQNSPGEALRNLKGEAL
ncbi:indole-3-glycerol phosphate synthase [Tindallia magadiensis]|uniref:Indole-3-glycerol phosphate synthase n=1 Tax=Tindallia magadiensis TaxID=69895 RepID=A0A1I3AZH0_9FIRM|nr:indole-3-glycerol phosphate synthase TrpC [Tindallia magadiensis]SFH55508.1 indole-3-glycerol phosphate synthase [Tindallia magadiensis]